MSTDGIKQKVYKAYQKVKLYTGEAAFRVKKTVKSAGKWVIENPEKAATVMTAGAILTRSANRLARGVKRTAVDRRETLERRTRIYDHSLNGYVYVKHPLSSEQIAFINNERRRTGKKVSEILYEMDLLRR